MIKKRLVLLAVLALFIVSTMNASAAFAMGLSYSSVLIDAKIAGAFFTDDGTKVMVSDTGTYTIKGRVTGSGLTAWCQNNGGNIAPGQPTVSVDVDSAKATNAFVDANGNWAIAEQIHIELLPVVNTDPSTGTTWKKNPYCPNGNWTVVDLTGNIIVWGSLYYTTSISNASDPSTWGSHLMTVGYRCLYSDPFQSVVCEKDGSLTIK